MVLNIYSMLTLWNISSCATTVVTTNDRTRPDDHLFWQFGVSAIGQHFDLSICEVLELQKNSWWDTRTQFLFSEVNGFNKFKL